MTPFDPEVLARIVPRLLDHAYRRGARWARACASDLTRPKAEWPALCPGAGIAADLYVAEHQVEPVFRGSLRDAFIEGAGFTWSALLRDKQSLRRAA